MSRFQVAAENGVTSESKEESQYAEIFITTEQVPESDLLLLLIGFASLMNWICFSSKLDLLLS